MVFIEFKHLSKQYEGGIVGLDNLNLEIPEGELLVLLGPSGCGKSTLLRLVAGLEQPTSGEISIDGQSINNIAPKDRNVAMVFQEYALYPHMTVRENLAFPLKMKRVKSNDIKSSINRTANLVGLTGLLDRKPKQLSGGQRQRVALGRALIRKPRVFLFDEPLSNLDYNLRLNLRREIAKLHQKTGITTIYVTHDQQEALALGNRVGILDNGKLIQCSNPEVLFNNPDNLFVAEFIGNPHINILEGFLNDDLILRLNVNSVGCNLSNYEYLYEYRNNKCLIGIRAHHFIISENDHREVNNSLSFPATLIRRENQGDYILNEFTFEESVIIVKTFQKASAFKLNNDYFLTVNAEDILLFEPIKGRRIFPRLTNPFLNI